MRWLRRRRLESPTRSAVIVPTFGDHSRGQWYQDACPTNPSRSGLLGDTDESVSSTVRAAELRRERSLVFGTVRRSFAPHACSSEPTVRRLGKDLRVLPGSFRQHSSEPAF